MIAQNQQKKLTKSNLEKLNAVFKRYPDILAVYLFGSGATGKLHRESDIDLAIVPKSKSLRKQKLDILTDIAHKGFFNIDLIFLDKNDIVLKYEAVRQNILVYQTPEFDRGATYSKIIRQYLDFYPYLTIQRRAYKKRILHDQT